MVKKIKRDFYATTDVVLLAKNLIGKVLCTQINQVITAGIITETEAYNGVVDRASHVYGERRTKRTEIMFGPPGYAYVYLCYGIHHLFNVVSGPKEVPHAVLIRGIKPLDGIEKMEKRRNKKAGKKNFSSGPGTLSKALGINLQLNKTDLCAHQIWIEDRNIKVADAEIQIGPRIGIDYAGKDKDLPYRFLWNS